MPRKLTVITTETGPVDLTSNFTATGAGADYSYNDSSSLRILIRFPDDGSGIPTNIATFASSHTLTPTYVTNGTVSLSSNLIGIRSGITAFLAEDSANTQALLTFSGTSPEDNIITFGNGSSDSAFSASFWVKLSSSYSASGARYFFGKGKTSDATDSEYFMAYKPSSAVANPNSLQLQLRDDSNGYVIQHGVSGVDLEDDNWHHVVVTYSGGGGADSSEEMKFYVDGVPKTTSAFSTDNSSGYVAMEPTSEEFHIGAGVDGNTEIDGQMAEFAMWGAELSSNTVKAIYHAQSDVTKETITFNSGYTNLSPRIQLRAMDNRPGCYPTKHRMGDKDRSGKNNIFYEDLPIKFGSCIKDDFEDIETPGGFAGQNNFKKDKWVVSNGMSIRTERVPGNGVTLIDKCAVFSGVGTGGKRFIRSAHKIINPIRFYFELIQGPYNNTTGGLDLLSGIPDTANGIKVQISLDANFTSPINVSTTILSANQREFYGIDDNDAEELNRPRKRVYLDLKSFSGFNEPYYFRFVQETYDTNRNNWAISKIEVDYANQVIRAPLLLNHGSGNEKFVSASLTTPHTDSDLLVTGRSVSGISDVFNPFQGFTEVVTPFNETLAVENNNSGFFNEGLDTDIYPGFSSPTKSKTKFTIDLSPREEITFGHVTRMSVTEANNDTAQDNSNNGQNLMIYWNKNLSRWEKIGQPVSHNNFSSKTLTSIENVLTESCLGFGPIANGGGISSGPSSGVYSSLFNKNILAASNKPISQFCFPFGAQYHATSSQSIKAKDIGITKPFLLEKLSITFQSKLEAVHLSAAGSRTRNMFNLQNYVGSSGYSAGTKLIVPTFFLLRQFKDNFKKEIVLNGKQNDNYHSLSVSIPTSNQRLISGSDEVTYVDNNRELITYSQIGHFLSASNDSLLDENGTTLQTRDLINRGLNFDKNIVHEFDGTLNSVSITGSYSIESNSKVYVKGPETGFFAYEYASGETAFWTSKEGSDRCNLDQQRNSRGLVNGLTSKELNGEESIVYSRYGTKNVQIPKQNELISPYIILPNDDLILGWQYPANHDPSAFSPGTDSVAFNSMTLFGKSKLHLYGSQVVENKEYHETVNQNLTSCAVYEHVIGDEKIVDQWQVAYRGELTGSYSRQHTYAASGYSTLHNKEVSFEWWDTPQYSFLVKQTDPPSFRIGAGSYSNLDTYDGFNASLPSILQLFIDAGQTQAGIAVVLVAANQYKSCYTSINFRDQDRLFSDKPGAIGGGVSAGKEDIVYYYDDSSYGTTQKQGFGNVSGYSDIDRPRPVYSFSRNHFGYYADMYRQGKDSKFKLTPRQGFTTGFDIVVNSESPIEIKFVSGTINNNPSLKEYTEKDIDAYLDEILFQSSNLSTAATSSIPFIDDNQPRNRGYIETEYVAVALF